VGDVKEVPSAVMVAEFTNGVDVTVPPDVLVSGRLVWDGRVLDWTSGDVGITTISSIVVETVSIRVVGVTITRILRVDIVDVYGDGESRVATWE
jgi:hypothetical protein